MPLPRQAIELEVERFKRLSQRFREVVTGGATDVVSSEEERERVYGILVQMNEFLEHKLREA